MSPSMTSSFSHILALALVVLAVNTEAIQFLTRYFECTNSEDGFEINQLFLASACQSAGSGTSFGGTCSNGEYKHFNSTDCTGTVLATFSDTCNSAQRFDCEDLNDAEYIRIRILPQTGPNQFDCDATSPVVNFMRLDKCYQGNTNIKSFKFTKVNATAYTETDYSVLGCNSANIIETTTIAADGTCRSGSRIDFVLAGDVGNSAGLVGVSGFLLSFALAFASILVMM